MPYSEDDESKFYTANTHTPSLGSIANSGEDVPSIDDNNSFVTVVGATPLNIPDDNEEESDHMGANIDIPSSISSKSRTMSDERDSRVRVKSNELTPPVSPTQVRPVPVSPHASNSSKSPQPSASSNSASNDNNPNADGVSGVEMSSLEMSYITSPRFEDDNGSNDDQDDDEGNEGDDEDYNEKDTLADKAAARERLRQEREAAEARKKQAEEKAAEANSVSYVDLFRYTTTSERVMLFFAFFFALGSGGLMPIFAVLFGDLLDAGFETDIQAAIREVVFKFIYYGTAIGVSGGLGFILFSLVGEALSSRVRSLYYQALLRQEVAWHDGIELSSGVKGEGASEGVDDDHGDDGDDGGSDNEMELAIKTWASKERVRRNAKSNTNTNTNPNTNTTSLVDLSDSYADILLPRNEAMRVAKVSVLKGDVSSRIGADMDTFQTGVGDRVAFLCFGIAGSISGLVISFTKVYQLTLVVMSTIPALALITVVMGLTAAKYSQRETAQNNVAAGFAVAYLSIVKHLHAHNMLPQSLIQYATTTMKASLMGRKKDSLQGLGTGLFFFGLFSVYALGLWYGAKLVTDYSSYSGGHVLAAFNSILLAVLYFGNYVAQPLVHIAIARRLIYPIYETIERHSLIDPSASRGVQVNHSIFSGRVVFGGVQFHYPSRPDIRVLKGLSLDFEAGKSYGLIGGSGCGKSTIIQLIERIYDVDEGGVYIEVKEDVENDRNRHLITGGGVGEVGVDERLLSVFNMNTSVHNETNLSMKKKTLVLNNGQEVDIEDIGFEGAVSNPNNPNNSNNFNNPNSVNNTGETRAIECDGVSQGIDWGWVADREIQRHKERVRRWTSRFKRRVGYNYSPETNDDVDTDLPNTDTNTNADTNTNTNSEVDSRFSALSDSDVTPIPPPPSIPLPSPAPGHRLVDVRDLNVTCWRRIVALVSQQGKMASGTVEENIVLGNNPCSCEAIKSVPRVLSPPTPNDPNSPAPETPSTDVSDDPGSPSTSTSSSSPSVSKTVCKCVLESSKIALSHEFISKLPNGYKTDMSTNSASLSGGQQQRLNIAHALHRAAHLYLFDEHTSALDYETETTVTGNINSFLSHLHQPSSSDPSSALPRKAVTSILVAHRYSALKHCDVIIRMDRGVVGQIDKHVLFAAAELAKEHSFGGYDVDDSELSLAVLDIIASHTPEQLLEASSSFNNNLSSFSVRSHSNIGQTPGLSLSTNNLPSGSSLTGSGHPSTPNELVGSLSTNSLHSGSLSNLKSRRPSLLPPGYNARRPSTLTSPARRQSTLNGDGVPGSGVKPRRLSTLDPSTPLPPSASTRRISVLDPLSPRRASVLDTLAPSISHIDTRTSTTYSLKDQDGHFAELNTGDDQVVILPQPIANHAKPPPVQYPSFLLSLTSVITPHTTPLVLMALFAFIEGGVFPAFSLLMSRIANLYFIRSLDPTQHIMSQASAFSGYLVLVGVGSGVFMSLKNATIAIISSRSVVWLRNSMVESLLRRALGWHEWPDHQASLLASYISIHPAVVRTFISDRVPAVFTVLGNIIATVLVCFLGFEGSGGYTLAVIGVCVCLPVLCAAAVIQAYLQTSASNKSLSNLAKACAVAAESAQNIRAIVTNTSEASSTRQVNTVIDMNKREGRFVSFARGIGHCSAQMGMYYSYALLFWYGGELVKNGEMGMGDMVRIFSAIQTCSQQLSQLVAVLSEYSRCNASLKVIGQCLNGSVVEHPYYSDPANYPVIINRALEEISEVTEVEKDTGVDCEQEALESVAASIEGDKSGNGLDLSLAVPNDPTLSHVSLPSRGPVMVLDTNANPIQSNVDNDFPPLSPFPNSHSHTTYSLSSPFSPVSPSSPVFTERSPLTEGLTTCSLDPLDGSEEIVLVISEETGTTNKINNLPLPPTLAEMPSITQFPPMLANKPDSTLSANPLTSVASTSVVESSLFNSLLYPQYYSAPGYSVSFSNVWFSYPTRDTPVLKGLSLEIRPGMKVAFVGESGCGKSSLFNLVMRFYDVDNHVTAHDSAYHTQYLLQSSVNETNAKQYKQKFEAEGEVDDGQLNLPLPPVAAQGPYDNSIINGEGFVAVNGVDVAKVDVATLRKHVTIIAQDIGVFACSVYDNVRCGDKSIPKARVVWACKQALFHDTIVNKFPRGYNTDMFGMVLSGGERARLGIARALCQNSSVILMDEATPALDPATEEIVLRNLRECTGKKTVLTIAHKLSSIQDYDMIVVVDDGVVLETGTHSELLASKGKYFDLVEAGKEGAKQN